MFVIPHRLALKLIVGLGCIALLALLVHDRNRWKSRTGHYSEMLALERAAHQATVAGYRVAAEMARLEDVSNAARVRAEQAAINERTEDEFESSIAAARAAAKRMRADTKAGSGNPSAPGAAAVPGLSAAAEGAVEGTGEEGFPDRDRLIATEQAIQLDELIKWVKQQARVDRGGN